MSAKTAKPKNIREAVLAAALPEVARHGFSEAVLRHAAKRLGLTRAEVDAAFPAGAASLLEAFSDWADARMIARMKTVKEEKLRARITAAVRARFEALTPHKEAARRAAVFAALPVHAPLAARLLYRTVDAMWRAAGDRSTDFNFYSKRAILAGVYTATALFWLGDASGDHKDTWAFLDRRIAGVMTFEKFKASARAAFAKLPDPFALLAGLRSRVR